MEKERKNKENKKEKEREIKNAAELLFILKKICHYLQDSP